jgi:hypothetical protein
MKKKKRQKEKEEEEKRKKEGKKKRKRNEQRDKYNRVRWVGISQQRKRVRLIFYFFLKKKVQF